MFQTNPVALADLLKQVRDGQIQLPDFQRGWVWDDYRIRGLMASISRGFPVGAIMTLDAGSEIRFKTRPIESVSVDDIEPSTFLLDGQQRLTSLYQAMVHEGPVITRNSRNKEIRRWYYVDMMKAMDPYTDREDAFMSVPEDRKTRVAFGRVGDLDLSQSEFEYKHHTMPTERLLDSMTWMFAYNNYWSSNDRNHPSGNLAEFLSEFNESILKTFASYLLPVINLTQDTPKEAVCTVFEKVNTGGVVLTVFELLTASLAADNFSLRDDWDSRKSRLSDYSGSLQGVGPDQFLQVIALLATQERRRQAIDGGATGNQIPGVGCKRRDILDLSLEEYNRWADDVEDGFKAAAQFLLEQFVFRSQDVPYGTQLVPLAAIFVELGRELDTADARTRLERWYWSGVFGESYGGNIETQFSLDLVQVSQYIRTGVEPTLISESNFIPERLLSLRTRNSAAYKGLYALQMKSGAADWLTAKPLTIATWAAGNNIDIHHIFPKAWCERSNPPIPPRLYNSVINKAPIDAVTNRKIGGRNPSVYLRQLVNDGISEENLVQVLMAHSINPVHLRSDQFADFFIERGEAMLRMISRAMGKDVPIGREVFRSALNAVGYYDDYDDGEPDYDAVGSIPFNAAAD